MNKPVQSAWADSTGQYQLYVASSFWYEDICELLGEVGSKNVQAAKAGMKLKGLCMRLDHEQFSLTGLLVYSSSTSLHNSCVKTILTCRPAEHAVVHSRILPLTSGNHSSCLYMSPISPSHVAYNVYNIYLRPKYEYKYSKQSVQVTPKSLSM